jgi:Zn-dependent metalloprotease
MKSPGINDFSLGIDYKSKRISGLFLDFSSWKLFDNGGRQIHVTLDCGTTCMNAYWTGSQIVLGGGWKDSTGAFARLEWADDVLARELTHGLISQRSGLLYHDEPGALNEYRADVFSILWRQWNNGLDPREEPSWIIGEDVFGLGKDPNKSIEYPI